MYNNNFDQILWENKINGLNVNFLNSVCVCVWGGPFLHAGQIWLVVAYQPNETKWITCKIRKRNANIIILLDAFDLVKTQIVYNCRPSALSKFTMFELPLQVLLYDYFINFFLVLYYKECFIVFSSWLSVLTARNCHFVLSYFAENA